MEFRSLRATALLIAVTAFLAAVVGVSVFCGIEALLPAAFWSDGQCSASNHSVEVFVSFLILGALAGAVAVIAAAGVRIALRRWSKPQ
jgi:hypothetical protein